MSLNQSSSLSPPAAELLIVGGAAPRGTLEPPGDKSLSHRLLLLSALADGQTRLRGLSTCRDVARSRAAMEALGVRIEDGKGDAVVYGVGATGLGGESVHLNCGDSGTTMRLLAGLLAGQDRTFVLSGSAALRQRPMRRVTDPLRVMGADMVDTDGRPPIVGHGGRLKARAHLLEQASAQVGSALLFAGLSAKGETVVRYPAPVRDHSERLLAEMGAKIVWNSRVSRLQGPAAALKPPAGGTYRLPADPSAAAFLWTAATIVPGGEVTTLNVSQNPGRDGLLEIIRRMGGSVTIDHWRVVNGEPIADVTVRHAPLHGINVEAAMIPRTIDELPLVAVLGASASGTTTVSDAAELRLKETDRIKAIVDGLKRMGADVHDRPDGFVVTGPTTLRGATVEGHGDHRIVMALAVAAMACSGQTRISDGERPADSFPGFVEAIRRLGVDATVTVLEDLSLAPTREALVR